MSEGTESVTIRRLPGGDARPARMIEHSLDRLTIILGNTGSEEALEAGALVEVDSDQALYLGKVLSRHADAPITVAIEHFLNRGALAEIEQAWKSVGA